MFLGAKRGYLNFRTLYRSQLFEPTTRLGRLRTKTSESAGLLRSARLDSQGYVQKLFVERNLTRMMTMLYYNADTEHQY